MDHAGADHGVGPDAGHGIDHDADPDAGRNAVHDGGHDEDDRVVGGGGGGLELGEQSHDTQSAVAQVDRGENLAENHGAHGAVDAGLDAGLGVQNATGVVQVSAKAGVVADRRKQGVDRAKARRREQGS